MHPDSRVRYRLDLPVLGGTEPGAGKLTLSFAIALEPDSWEQPGDGTAFALYVAAADGTRQVFSAYIDPKQLEADRRWHSYQVDLSAFAGQTVTVEFETSGGPAGDLRFDWAGWASPRLLETGGAD
jgi:hypothetical protein